MPQAYQPPQNQVYQNQRPTNNGNNLVWVGKVTDNITEKDLRDEFSHFGNIELISVSRQKNCAFVRFVDHESAAAVLSNSKTINIKGSQLRIGWGKPESFNRSENRNDQRKDKQQTKKVPMKDLPIQPIARTIWVGNVQEDFTADMIKEQFEKFGNILNIRMMLQRV